MSVAQRYKMNKEKFLLTVSVQELNGFDIEKIDIPEMPMLEMRKISLDLLLEVLEHNRQLNKNYNK